MLRQEDDYLAFDAVRQAAQCAGRVIRSKADYGGQWTCSHLVLFMILRACAGCGLGCCGNANAEGSMLSNRLQAKRQGVVTRPVVQA